MLVASLLAADAQAEGVDQPNVQPKPSFWNSGPAGGAFGLFVEGGATAGTFAGYPFAAVALGLGGSLRWFEASFTGYYGSSFGTLDGPYSAGGFLGRAAVRVPAKYLGFSLGADLGYVAVTSGNPAIFTRGLVFEPLSFGVDVDPVCHLRIGVVGALGTGYSVLAVGIFRGAITVGYVMGACSK